MKHELKGVLRLALAAVCAMAVSLAVPLHDAEAGITSTKKKAAFEDVVQDLQDAIINKGLVIDYIGNVDDMLQRTGSAVGGETPFLAAKYMHFCSAQLTHTAVQADPMNVAVCPYVVFAYEAKAEPGTVVVGYRDMPNGANDASTAAIDEIEKLLDEVIAEAMGN